MLKFRLLLTPLEMIGSLEKERPFAFDRNQFLLGKHSSISNIQFQSSLLKWGWGWDKELGMQLSGLAPADSVQGPGFHTQHCSVVEARLWNLEARPTHAVRRDWAGR